MKKGWEIKKLGEVCEEIFAGGDIPKDKFSKTKTAKFKIPIYSNGEKSKGLYGFTDIEKVSKLSITISARGTIGYTEIRKEIYYPAIRLIVVIPKNDILDLSFLNHGVRNMNFISSGTSIPQLTVPMVKQYKIPVPPLSEQKRIAVILDETFEALDKAKANAQRNLENAKELFENYLESIFKNKGDGWEEKKISDCFRLKSGDGLTSKEMIKNGIYPVYGGNGIAGFCNNYNLEGNNIIIGRVGALCGNVRYINEKIWLTDNAFRILNFKYEFDYSFLTYLLNYKNLRRYARQAAQPVISNSSLESVMLKFPRKVTEQQAISKRLDLILKRTKKMEAIYIKKIEDLEELKKSILQKAFNGELITSNSNIA